MTTGGKPRGKPSEVERLLSQLQASVDRAKADRQAAPTVPCDRTWAHPAHTYVATAKSGVDLYCERRPS